MNDHWPEIFNEIKQRYPNWNPTPPQIGDWKRAIGGWNLKWVQEALYRIERDKSPSVPKIKLVIAELKELREKAAQDEVLHFPSAQRRREIDENVLKQQRSAWRDILHKQDSDEVEYARTVARERYSFHAECLKHAEIDRWTLGAMVAVMTVIDPEFVENLMRRGGVSGEMAA